MAGLIPGVARMTGKLAALGYRHAAALHPNLLTEGGGELRGHEFRYSTWVCDEPIAGDDIPGKCAARGPKLPRTREDSRAAIYSRAICNPFRATRRYCRPIRRKTRAAERRLKIRVSGFNSLPATKNSLMLQ